jgi:hypothetical protein
MKEGRGRTLVRFAGSHQQQHASLCLQKSVLGFTVTNALAIHWVIIVFESCSARSRLVRLNEPSR